MNSIMFLLFFYGVYVTVFELWSVFQLLRKYLFLQYTNENGKRVLQNSQVDDTDYNTNFMTV